MTFIGFNTWKKSSNRYLERPEVMPQSETQKAFGALGSAQTPWWTYSASQSTYSWQLYSYHEIHVWQSICGGPTRSKICVPALMQSQEEDFA